MTPIFKSLDEISTGYTVFERDQVLTHEQLNSLANYADDQIRLTRVKLMGVGVACGLRATASDLSVIVTKGVGVTTDGDLLYLNGDTEYTQFRVYDETYPAYPPLYENGDVTQAMLPAFELLTDDVTDDRAQPISMFGAVAGSDMDQMIAVLLMESYLRDEDLCSGTDCDNLGNEATNTIKVILVDQSTATAMMESVDTARGAFTYLAEIIDDRPIITSVVNTGTAIAGLYRASCAITHTSLTQAISRIYPPCAAMIADIFPVDPASAWNAQLNTIRTSFAGVDTNIQYYYDFLKDCVETYNAFRELLFNDTTWCSPDTASFPKHLVLGSVATGADPSANRTGYYPSPLASRTTAEVDRAKFLLQKLGALINNFLIPANGVIRITPSSFEDVSLEDRAIPYYYRVTNPTQIPHYWNFKFARRGTETNNYSYNGAAYGARGGAANPYHAQIGRFAFYRIEGHLGQPVSTVLSTIKSQIKANNIPIAVRAIMTGTDQTKIAIKPVRYNDLQRLSYMVRQDLVYQLDDVAHFSTSFTDKVYAEPSTLVTNSDNCACASIRNLATTTNTLVASHVADTRAKLNVSYATYRTDTAASWQTDLRNTLTSSSQYKSDLGAVAQTNFVTPVDTLISSTHASWLPWLDTLIDTKNDQEDQKLLFGKFVDTNPGVEHYAGVLRGGTFLLVYDSTNTVIADFMLPYYVPEMEDAVVTEPPLVRPNIKPDYVVNSGIVVQPSRAAVVDTKLIAFATPLKAEVYGAVDTKILAQDQRLQLTDQRVDFQNQYVGLFQSSIGLLGSTVPRADQLRDTCPDTNPDPTDGMTDEYIIFEVKEINALAAKVDMLRRKEADTADGAYQAEADDTEKKLSEAIYSFMKHIIGFRIGAPAGSDMAAAGDLLVADLVWLTTGAARDEFVQFMDELTAATGDDNIRAILSQMRDAVRG